MWLFPNISRATLAVALATTILSLEVSTFAAADAISNQRAWNNLETNAKSFYALGVLEGFLIIGPFDTDNYKSDLYHCIADLDLRTHDLLRIIEEQYSLDLRNSERPPTQMLLPGIRQICLTQVNTRRIDRGQQPLE